MSEHLFIDSVEKLIALNMAFGFENTCCGCTLDTSDCKFHDFEPFQIIVGDELYARYQSELNPEPKDDSDSKPRLIFGSDAFLVDFFMSMDDFH